MNSLCVLVEVCMHIGVCAVVGEAGWCGWREGLAKGVEIRETMSRSLKPK